MTARWCAIVLGPCLTILNPNPAIAANAWQKAQAAADRQQWHQAQIQLESWLQQQPKHEEARFLLARVLSWQAKYQEAADLYSELLSDKPDNADYLLGLAQVHFWQNRPHDAIPLLNRALKNAPDYQAVWELLVRSLYAADDRVLAEEIQRQAVQRFPYYDWQRLTPPVAVAPTLPADTEYKNSVEIGGSYEKLDRNYASWNSAYVGGIHHFSKRSNIYGRLSQADRFDLQDASIMAGLTHPLSERWTLNVETDESPTYRFLPQWSLLGSAHYKMDYGLGVTFGFHRASYREQDNDTGSVGIERYWGNWRFGYTLYISQLETAPEPTFSHLGQIAYFYHDHDYVGIAIGGGQEAVRFGPGQLANADTETYSLRGQHNLTREWALVYDLNLNVQGLSYTRRGAGIGLRYAF